MRIKKLYIKEFKNLKDFEIDFDTQSPYTVLVGRNGTGKSNLLEAITRIFRDLDLKETHRSDFHYSITYEIAGEEITVDYGVDSKNKAFWETKGKPKFFIGDNNLSYNSFYNATEVMGKEFLPMHVFGYYSGTSERFNDIFSKHAINNRNELVNNSNESLRKLFRADKLHSQFVLLAFYSEKREKALKFLREYFGIKKFLSALFVFNEPYWKPSKPNKIHLEEGDERFWWSRGKVKELLSILHDVSLAPMTQTFKVDAGLNKKKTKEHKFYYIKDLDTLRNWTADLDQKDFFKLLDSSVLSDLFKEVQIKFELESGETITFSELSEGEQQLLTVLGLIKFTNEDESLFLLDEPDTHLNPAWSLDYLSLLKEYGGGMKKNQIITTTHCPLTFAGLSKEEVIVLQKSDDGIIYAENPSSDPRGMGFAAILTSEFFGLRSQLDSHTLALLEEKRDLGFKKKRTKAEETRLVELNNILGPLDFNDTVADPLYYEFTKAMTKEAGDELKMPVLSSAAIKRRRQIAQKIVKKIKAEQA